MPPSVAGGDASQKMPALSLRVAQSEADVALSDPTFQHHATAEYDRSLERHIERARPRESRIADSRRAVRQRPHAVCNGTFEAEKARARIRDVNRIEVAGHTGILPANRRWHGECQAGSDFPAWWNFHHGWNSSLAPRATAIAATRQKSASLGPHNVGPHPDLRLQINLLSAGGFAMSFQPCANFTYVINTQWAMLHDCIACVHDTKQVHRECLAGDQRKMERGREDVRVRYGQ